PPPTLVGSSTRECGLPLITSCKNPAALPRTITSAGFVPACSVIFCCRLSRDVAAIDAQGPAGGEPCVVGSAIENRSGDLHTRADPPDWNNRSYLIAQR